MHVANPLIEVRDVFLVNAAAHTQPDAGTPVRPPLDEAVGDPEPVIAVCQGEVGGAQQGEVGDLLDRRAGTTAEGDAVASGLEPVLGEAHRPRADGRLIQGGRGGAGGHGKGGEGGEDEAFHRLGSRRKPCRVRNFGFGNGPAGARVPLSPA